MKQNLWRLLIACLLLTVSAGSYSQAMVLKRYDTTGYPEDRKAIEIMCRKGDSSRFLNGDYIGVGAEGKTYFSFADEMQEIKNGNFTVKSATPFPVHIFCASTPAMLPFATPRWMLYFKYQKARSL
ncbi:MAG TPA: hypothetical protein VM871_11340 [Flavisolibacter sp.]|jgi:hypothetical protein|nr:hypothetical protein [Flavisolibacter sp.]